MEAISTMAAAMSPAANVMHRGVGPSRQQIRGTTSLAAHHNISMESAHERCSRLWAFVCDYPASQAALARLKPRVPPVAARFEVFARGIELANGFHELTDAAEQRRRFEKEIDARRRLGRHAPPLDEAFLDALGHGLPDCAGVAVGVDRLVALALGADDVAGALAFVHRPRG